MSALARSVAIFPIAAVSASDSIMVEDRLQFFRMAPLQHHALHIECSVRNRPHPAQEETLAGTQAHLLELGPVALLASLTDHEEQATCSGSLRRWPLPDTDVQKTTRQLGHTLQLSLPCEQHHHRVHVDDGDDWPANREKRVPGFRSTKLPLTSRRPLKPLSEATFRH